MLVFSRNIIKIKIFVFLLLGLGTLQAQSGSQYQELVQLFEEWRDFETPPTLNGAPDYTKKRFNKDHRAFKSLTIRLNKINFDDWKAEQQIDWHVVRAEMNGYDFNYRVLRPWERDPAFYQTIWTYKSDVPAHEGPTNHAVLELWTYRFPITEKEQARLSAELSVIPPLLKGSFKVKSCICYKVFTFIEF